MKLTNRKMAVEIKCNSAINIAKNDEGDVIKIVYENVEVKLFSYEKVKEIMFRVYNCYDGSYEHECAIEIVVDKGGDYVFTFPYSMRGIALIAYDKLFKMLQNFN
jgi:hypothetical protein